MAVVNLTSESFDEEVLLSGKTVLVDFYADWCGPCKALAPVIDELSRESAHARVLKVNIEEAPELAKAYHVLSIPTLILFKAGQEAERLVGVRSKTELSALLEG